MPTTTFSCGRAGLQTDAGPRQPVERVTSSGPGYWVGISLGGGGGGGQAAAGMGFLFFYKVIV